MSVEFEDVIPIIASMLQDKGSVSIPLPTPIIEVKSSQERKTTSSDKEGVTKIALSVRHLDWTPNACVLEESELIILLEIPGINKKDIEIDIQEKKLSMHGSRRSPDFSNAKYRMNELSMGSFFRQLTFPPRCLQRTSMQHSRMEHSLSLFHIPIP
jgi:HSP20 family molecular chaperone IbpA